jgi:mycothiol synthase
MDRALPGTRITMKRPHLEGLPVVPLPSGFSLRYYRPGDITAWLHIHQAAGETHPVTPELYWREFAAGETQLRQRQLFLCEALGPEVGTATAWFDDHHQGGSWGRLHWVALSQTHQGRGLGRALAAAACLRLRELGHTRAYLRTQPDRVPAIRLYLSLGFVPDIVGPADRCAWEELRLA